MKNDTPERPGYFHGAAGSGSCNSGSGICPLCKVNDSRLLYAGETVLSRCKKCGIIFNKAHRVPDYNDDYFTVQYNNQYGKTYVEDFENIYKASVVRIKRILQLAETCKKGKKTDDISLLDLGSATGFFLKAARDYGIEKLLGIEISGYAAKYCAEKLGINVINASFSDINLPGLFNIITAWYFIEHLPDTAETVSEIYNSLNPGGIFAFSVPSFFGPQYIFAKSEWFRSHPADHRVDFSPAAVRKFLKKIGFSRIYTYPGGIHPERIIRKGSAFFPFFSTVYSSISNNLSFSDTLEVYAVKSR